MTDPAELRAWNDLAPDIAVGMEGSPGHQAVAVMAEGLQPSMYDRYLGARVRAVPTVVRRQWAALIR